MPLILPARTLDSGFNIDNSLRFNDGDSPSLGRIPSSASNKRTWTWSAWVKISTGTAHDHTFFSGGTGLGASGNRVVFCILSGESEKVMVFSGNTSQFALKTSASLRDKSAFYHFVLAMDTTQSTESNRFKMYINGSQVTDTAQLTYPSQNLELGVNTDQQHYIGFRSASNDTPFDGYMADVNFADGTQYAASDFGEYNDNGVWIPKEPNITYGTNGYRLEFKQTGTSANSSGIGADTSGNDNHFAVNNLAATDVTVDTPTNNWCTYNFLATPESLAQYGTFSEGNTTYTGHSNNSYGSSAVGTFGVSKGKWYWENKITTTYGNGIGTGIRDIAEWNPDWANDSTFNHTDAGGDGGYSLNYKRGKPQHDNAETTTNQTNEVLQNDIVMHAMDLDNGALYYGINGTWQASCDPTSGASKTNAQHSFTVAGVYSPAAYSYGSAVHSTNFGNPPFAISSGNSDSAGLGNFEYTVPSGYYSLCTKNLAEYG